MPTLISRAFEWRLVIAKGALLTIIGMGTMLVAAMQNWTPEYVSTLQWYHWLCLVVSLIVNGCNTVYGFMDKTFQLEGEKIEGDRNDAKLEAKEAKLEAKETAKRESEITT